MCVLSNAVYVFVGVYLYGLDYWGIGFWNENKSENVHVSYDRVWGEIVHEWMNVIIVQHIRMIRVIVYGKLDLEG